MEALARAYFSRRRQALFSHQDYSSLLERRRMKISTPNTTTSPAHNNRSIPESISVLLSSLLSYRPVRAEGLGSGAYILSMAGSKSRTSVVMTGPIVTTNSDGITQKKIGKTSFTASLAALSSARCRAITRK